MTDVKDKICEDIIKTNECDCALEKRMKCWYYLAVEDESSRLQNRDKYRYTCEEMKRLFEKVKQYKDKIISLMTKYEVDQTWLDRISDYTLPKLEEELDVMEQSPLIRETSPEKERIPFLKDLIKFRKNQCGVREKNE